MSIYELSAKLVVRVIHERRYAKSACASRQNGAALSDFASEASPEKNFECAVHKVHNATQNFRVPQ